MAEPMTEERLHQIRRLVAEEASASFPPGSKRNEFSFQFIAEDLLAEVDRLRAALARYGGHRGCDAGRRDYDDAGKLGSPQPCTCGFDAALATKPAPPGL